MTVMSQVARPAEIRPMTREEKKIILASSLGTVFEWYDFYLYGSLAVIIGTQFFSSFPETTRNIFALLAFAAGFLVRPFGALVFGRLGDLAGRKHTFLMTITIMGAATFLVGLLPGYESIGWLAPVALIVLRMAQGLALGGEYGGAATYVAEHAPKGRRGFYTSFIQTTATLGLLLSLIVIMVSQSLVDGNFAPTLVTRADGTVQTITAFEQWGWRIPFLMSVALLAISVWIRLQMQESPVFQKMKTEGTRSRAPISEAFGQWKNARLALIALFGLVAGQAVVWYTGQFYALFFLQSILKVDQFTTNVLIAWALVLGTGGFLVFGALSDRVGRRMVILTGCVIAAMSFFPIFKAMTGLANPALARAQASTEVLVIADPDDCSFQFNPTGTAKFTSSCDVAKALLARQGVAYQVKPALAGSVAQVRVGDVTIPSFDASHLSAAEATTVPADFTKNVVGALTSAGFPGPDDPEIIRVSHPLDIFNSRALSLIGLLTVLVLFVTMVYGPIAAALAEMFPTRIRYTSMSLPYHIGNGWFGGLLPAAAFAMVAATGDIYYGLWYPTLIAFASVAIGVTFMPETKDVDITR